MTRDTARKTSLTWNKAGGLTLLALSSGILLGIWMMGQRIFLAPPLAPGTFYFYLAVGLLPALITLLIATCSRPTGKRLMIVALPVFSCVILVVYLVIIGPGLYTDIQCLATAGLGPSGHLECSCQVETSEGKGRFECTADELSPLPLIRLVEEKRGVP
ncbi:MAG: hypothetical protein AB1649_16970 [Chloroflexota bacterium]